MMRLFALGLTLFGVGLAFALAQPIPGGYVGMPFRAGTTHGPGHVWNPSDATAGITLSNSNQTATHNTSGAYDVVRAAKGLTSGKWYWEIKIVAAPTIQLLGIADSTTAIGSFGGTYCGTVANSAGMRNGIALGNFYFGGGMTSDSSALINFANNDIYGFAVDITAAKAWIAKNGTFITNTGGVGNPAGGTNQSYHWTPAGTWFPCWVGFDASVSATIIDGFTTAFNFTPPTGFGFYSDAP